MLTTVNYEYTSNTYKASKWLNSLNSPFAADFESASRYTDKEKDEISNIINSDANLSAIDIKSLLLQYNSNGLSHPSLSTVTHLSIADSPTNSYVIVCDNNKTRNLCFKFLVSTHKTQIWHNCQFDFKHLLHHTNKLPISFIDTMILAKCLKNDASNNFKNKLSLKWLMSYKYGDWALSEDHEYSLDNLYDPNFLRYTAIDSCATYQLYTDIQQQISNYLTFRI